MGAREEANQSTLLSHFSVRSGQRARQQGNGRTRRLMMQASLSLSLCLCFAALGLPATVSAKPVVTVRAKIVPIPINPSSPHSPTYPGTGNILGAPAALEATLSIIPLDSRRVRARSSKAMKCRTAQRSLSRARRGKCSALSASAARACRRKPPSRRSSLPVTRLRSIPKARVPRRWKSSRKAASPARLRHSAQSSRSRCRSS
jgi:hypothetical protein